MKIKNQDWLDCSLFLLLASAEVTDHYLTETEISSILERAEGLVATFNFDKKPFTRDEILEKFNMTFERYDAIGETAPQGKMNTFLKKEVFDLTAYMKVQSWFSNDFAQVLLNDLVILADADGETIKNEKQLINKIAAAWNLAQPFS